MSNIKKLVNHSSHYFIGQVLVMASGFVSFPILTRIFSVSDYGKLGLVTTTVMIAIAIAKVGVPSSIVRFYSEFKTANHLSSFYSTIVFGYGALAISAAVIVLIGVRLMPKSWIEPDMQNMAILLSILVAVNCLSAIVMSFLRAEQKTKSYNVITVLSRYSSLALGIIFVFLFLGGLRGFFFGQILSGVAIVGGMLYLLRKRGKIACADFSLGFFKKTLKFGVFLSWSELGYLLLSYGDRFLIQYYLGSTALGMYTAGYNLATYVIQIIVNPINNAIDPITLRIFAEKGEEETKLFLRKSFRYFLLVIFPIAIVFIAVADDLITLLASKKYAEVYPIVPYVVIGNAIYACQFFLNAGLVVKKKTYIFTNVQLLSCVVNIGLNVVLIPRHGIIGAAQATLLSFIFYTAVIMYYSFRELSFSIDYVKIGSYICASIATFLAVKGLDFGSTLLNLSSKIGSGVLLYIALVIVLDKELRLTLLTYDWRSSTP